MHVWTRCPESQTNSCEPPFLSTLLAVIHAFCLSLNKRSRYTQTSSDRMTGHPRPGFHEHERPGCVNLGNIHVRTSSKMMWERRASWYLIIGVFGRSWYIFTYPHSCWRRETSPTSNGFCIAFVGWPRPQANKWTRLVHCLALRRRLSAQWWITSQTECLWLQICVTESLRDHFDGGVPPSFCKSFCWLDIDNF